MGDVRVMIIDDHALLRQAVRHLLMGEEGLDLVAEAGDLKRARRQLAATAVDVLLLDCGLREVNGVDAIPELLRERPGLRIIMLTVCDDEGNLLRAIRLGACGYILKDTTPGQLIEAIRAAMDGECAVSRPLVRTLFQHLGQTGPAPPPALSGVSLSEQRVLGCLLKGLSNKEIAQELGISPNTVRNQLQRLQDHLKARNRVQLALLARELGLDRGPAPT